MRRPTGLKLRGGRWHIHKTVRVGERRVELQEATGFEEGQLAEAAALLERRIAETQAQLLAPPAPPPERTFNQAAVEYVLDLEARGKDRDGRAQQDLDRLSPWIGGLPLSHVHQQALRPFEDAARAGWSDAEGRRHRPLSSGTVARAYRTVIAVLNHAARVLRDGNRPWLAHAVPRIRPPDWGDKRQPAHLAWADQDRLIAALPAHLVAPVLFAVGTGAREQEVVTLRWDQAVQVPTLPRWAVWWIPPGIRKGSSRTAPSDQEGRYLIAGALARSVIEERWVASDAAEACPWVFPGPKGQRMRGLTNHGWTTARTRAGLELRIHDLRHTFGVRLGEAGVPWVERKVLLGHRIHDITAHYSGPGLKRLVEYADLVTRETAPMLRPVEGPKVVVLRGRRPTG